MGTRELVPEPKSVFTSSDRVFLLDSLGELGDEVRAKVEATALYAHRDAFVGYVTRDSNINIVNFIIVRDREVTAREISEGTILRTTIYGEDALYQVINGNTREERLQDFDSHGFIVGIARKLGKYNATAHELETRRWMPSIYSPLFFAHDASVTPQRVKQIAATAIGRLPATDLEIRLVDINAVVTHNTAILGILGIGKSCLAYEIAKRVSAEGIKIVCIDVTNEYRKEIPPYVGGAAAVVADDEHAFDTINTKFGYVHTEGAAGNQKQVPDKSGNLVDYKAAIRDDLTNFLFGAAAIPDPPTFENGRKIRIYNVDYHKASKGEKIGFNVLAVEMTQAEKTRVIAEELFKLLMKIPLADTKKAKVLLVFEEAHSLIPEWNSVASEGDRNATNGTAKVILQGRKYGLGSMVITQRTANVSKSILNQCNTIFALRVFDDTGKGFLENYIGGDYAATLSTLDERHAIAIGKGLRLKQPVIIQLNDRADVV
jgi:DNA helicase HerA-like ATPase